MNDTYEWLYNNYAVPQLKDMMEAGDAQMELLLRAHSAPAEVRIFFLDLLSNIRFQWGAETFLLGMQMGMGLALPPDLD